MPANKKKQVRITHPKLDKYDQLHDLVPIWKIKPGWVPFDSKNRLPPWAQGMPTLAENYSFDQVAEWLTLKHKSVLWRKLFDVWSYFAYQDNTRRQVIALRCRLHDREIPKHIQEKIQKMQTGSGGK